MIEALIVTYNSAGEIEECLDAAAQAGIGAAVLDNRSSDGTADLVAERFPLVRLWRSATNLGFGGGTNALAQTSAAEYVMPLNPDAILAPDTPARLQAALDADPSAIAAGPWLEYASGERQPSNCRFPDLRFEIAQALAGTRLLRVGRWDGAEHLERVLRQSYTAEAAVEPTEVLWATCWLLRRTDVQRHGLFDPAVFMYDEDLDYCARMAAAGRRFLYVPTTRVVHYGGASSTSRRKRKLALHGRHLYYRRHRGRLYAAVFLVSIRIIKTGLFLQRRCRQAQAVYERGTRRRTGSRST